MLSNGIIIPIKYHIKGNKIREYEMWEMTPVIDQPAIDQPRGLDDSLSDY